MDKDDNTAVMGFWRIMLVVVMCVFGWFAYTWLAFDVRTAGALESSLPGWFFVVPVVLWMLGWITLGLGTFVFPPGRGHMRLRSALALWIISCITGFGIVIFGLIAEPGTFRVGGILTAGGLILLAVILVMLLFQYPPNTEILFSHILSTLLFAAAFSTSAGGQQGFVYRFPGSVLGMASFLFFVTGTMEIRSARPGTTRLSILWEKKSHSTPSATSSSRPWWRFHGAGMMLCALLFFMILVNNTFGIAPDVIEDARSIMLDIPPRETWTWIAEPSHFLMWNTDFTEYIIPEITQEYEGSTYYLIGERNGKRYILECSITKWHEPHEFSFHGSSTEFDVHSTYMIEPTENGSVVTCTDVYTFRNLRERMASALSGGCPPRLNLEERLKNLREVTGSRQP